MTVEQAGDAECGRSAVIVGLGLAFGCAPPKKRQFNNILAKLNQDLSAKAKEFYKAVAPLEKGQNVRRSNARSA